MMNLSFVIEYEKILLLSTAILGGGDYHSIPGKIEHGDRRLDVVEYVQYCNALGIDPEEGIKIIQKQLKALRK